ncbi:MAG: hypothetical protein EOM19_01470 [Candidatus Moranbacteria bacterium]|nr:hypothetical protein [Candidatus Moranbacteria bacterium]
MPNKTITGYKEKQMYRNERFTKGVVSTNDPLFEGSFRRLMNFKISNQNASSENREPFLSVPLFDLNNEKIKLSKDAFVFALNNNTEHAFIFDPHQEKISVKQYEDILLEEDIEDGNDFYVIDGDTIEVKGQRYRLAFVDAPETDDDSFEAKNGEYDNLGQEAKAFTKTFLESKFSIVQFAFQSEKVDKFGRKIVFAIKESGSGYKILNLELLKEGYAHLYNYHNFEKPVVDLYIPEFIKIKEFTFPLFSETKNAYETGMEKEHSCFGVKYTNTLANILVNSENEYFTKAKVYKIKKDTDLKKIELENEEYEYEEHIIKRVIKEFEISDIEVKKDLEIFNDESLDYQLISRDFSIINGKYRDQHLNMYVQVRNQFGNEVYRGLLELSYTPGDSQNGIEEGFEFITYKKPEAHIEIQDVVNSKPNILDDRSIIPVTYRGVKANVKGYSSPSVNAVLLNVNLNKRLERPNEEEEEIVTKYFQTNRPIFEDIKRYNLTPFFKAPVIRSDKNKYMYRWGFTNLKEIDTSNIEAMEKFKPFFRSAWAELADNPNETNNISTNSTRTKKIATALKNIKTADDFYMIKSKTTRQTINSETVEDFDINELEDGGSPASSLKDIQELFNSFIEENTLDEIKETLCPNDSTSAETTVTIGEYDFVITKITDKATLREAIELNEKDDSFAFEEKCSKEGKYLSEKERNEIFESEENKNKKIAFIFSGISVIYENGDDPKYVVHYADETKGIVFDLTEDRKSVIPYNLNMGDLREMEIEGLDFDDFFKNGIQATFYLMTYEDIESLLEEDVFYDNLAYKKASATYFFRKGNIFKYKKEDFIDDRLDKESFVIKYGKYVTAYQDRIVTYGNPMYKNTVSMSEEGAPYYFSLYNVFEFDHEVVHVQTFKTIMLVFTINDIWVIYPWEDKNMETGIVTISYRTKKILYNISTEEKNKVTIKNITRYITLLSNNVLYLIKPSTYIGDDTEFYLNILSQNIDGIVKNPLSFINERLRYFGIEEEATTYDVNLNATDNYIKLYYSVKFDANKHYTLIETYDILNNRWYEEDTISFGNPHQIYLLDSTTKYEMLTEMNDQLFITYQTDKYKMLMMDEYGQSYYDKNFFESYDIEYFIDSGYLKLNEHLKKRFKTLQVNMKNIDCKEIMFGYNFTIDDRQFENNFEPYYVTNDSGIITEIAKDKRTMISNTGILENFLLDFSNLQTGDIITMKQHLLGIGRLPRIKLNFNARNRFYILSFGMIYSEHGGK